MNQQLAGAWPDALGEPIMARLFRFDFAEYEDRQVRGCTTLFGMSQSEARAAIDSTYGKQCGA